jgi:hypothetical protein
MQEDAQHIGWGEGSYALGDARDAGLAPVAPEQGLPGLRDGARPFARRLLVLGEQAIADGMAARGESYAGYEPRSYQEKD